MSCIDLRVHSYLQQQSRRQESRRQHDESGTEAIGLPSAPEVKGEGGRPSPVAVRSSVPLSPRTKVHTLVRVLHTDCACVHVREGVVTVGAIRAAVRPHEGVALAGRPGVDGGVVVGVHRVRRHHPGAEAAVPEDCGVHLPHRLAKRGHHVRRVGLDQAHIDGAVWVVATGSVLVL